MTDYQNRTKTNKEKFIEKLIFLFAHFWLLPMIAPIIVLVVSIYEEVGILGLGVLILIIIAPLSFKCWIDKYL